MVGDVKMSFQKIKNEIIVSLSLFYKWENWCLETKQINQLIQGFSVPKWEAFTKFQLT